MGDPGIDPNLALEVMETLLFWIACILGGGALLGFCAYVVFLCLEIFSPQPRPKVRLAKPPLPIGCAPVAEENLGLSATETPVPAEAERLDEEAVRVPAAPHDSQMPMTLVPVSLGSEPTTPWGVLNFLRFWRAVVPQKRRSSLRANALTGTMREAKSDFPSLLKRW